MRTDRSLVGLACWLTGVAVWVCAGCVTSSGGGGGGGDGDGTGNANDNATNDNEVPDPVRCRDNTPPAGELIFPPVDGDVSVEPGEVAVLWEVEDSDGGEVTITVFISDQPNVFDNPLFTQEVRENLIAGAGPVQQRATVELTQTGTFYAGVEISDDCRSTIRRPADGQGARFVVAVGGGGGRVDAAGVILLCPGGSQLARRATTFEWSMGDTQAQGISLFVSRAAQPNPFNSPLLVLRDIQPDQASVALEDENVLPVGEELSWGLRIQTQDEVLFTFDGQVGRSFTVGENVAPSGELLGPEAGAVLADATASLLLRWQADAGNCEDTLTSTVFFEYLGDRNTPRALFASPISEPLAQNRLELNAATVRDRLDQGGLWAWGVLAGDGTDSTELPAVQSQANFLTFVRNTAPRFDALPAIGQRVCGLQSGPIDTLEFTYADDNGLNSVAVTLYYADVEADVFDAPAATETFAPDQIASTAGQVGLVVDARGGTGCLEFNQGLGFYGVELDDGVNGPVRAAIEYAGLDCNKNGIVDSADIASGTSRDCNRNGIPDDCELATGDGNGNGVLDVCEVPQFPDCNGNGIPDSQDISSETSNDCNADGIPDECQGSPLCDAGTLRTGVIAGGAYNSVENEVNTNHLRGNICNVPAGRPAAVPSWTLDSRPPGSEVFINSPYFIRPAVSGSYVFRLTETLSGVSDTVALTLVALQ